MPNFRSEPQNHVLHSRTNQESQASAVGSNPSAIMRTSGESLATISSTNTVGLPSVRLASGAGLEPTSPTCAGALTVKLPWIRLSLAWGMAVLDMCRFSTHPGALPMCRFSTHTDEPFGPFFLMCRFSTRDSVFCDGLGGAYKRRVRHPIFQSPGLADVSRAADHLAVEAHLLGRPR